MRAISSNLENAITQPKIANARVTFRKTLPVFTNVPLSDSLSLPEDARIDCCEYGSGILRVTNFGDVLHTQYIEDIEGEWPAWVNTGRTIQGHPAVDGGIMWFQDAGQVFRQYFSESEELIASVPTLSELAPIEDRAWAMYKLSDNSRLEIATLNEGGATYGIYGEITAPTKFDVVELDGKEYFYTMDRDAGRIIEIQHSGDCYGVGNPIIPIDAIDDDYGLVFGAANVVNGKVVVTGRMTRTSDGTPIVMDVYCIGPKYFTLGIEMFIQNSVILNGKMLLVGDKLVVSGVGDYSIADATWLFGYDNPSLKLATNDFAQFTLTETDSRSTSVSMEMSSDLATQALISPGCELELEMTYDDGINDDWVRLTTCEVADKGKGTSDVGADFSVSAIGKSTRRLAAWSPDQGIYVPSQATMWTNPKTLDQMVRAYGTWEDATEITPDEETFYPIQLKEFNKFGVLYSAERSSRGGAMRGRFYFPPSTKFSPRHGVAINYYMETAQEAADRLDILVCAVDKNSYGHNGIVAVYGLSEHVVDEVGYPGIGLYLWTNNVMTKLTSAPFTIPVLTLHWLQIVFIEGDIRVEYKEDGGVIWDNVISFKYEDPTRLPWKRETLGRGALVMMNVTPSIGGYALSASDTIIAVDDNTDYPDTGTIMLDGEIVEYTGKSLYNIYKDKANPGYQVKSSSFYKLDEAFSTGARSVIWTDSVDDEAHGKEDGYYENAAAVVRGAGFGNTYQIVNFDAVLPQQWIPNALYNGCSQYVGNTDHGHWQDCDTIAKGLYLSPDPNGVVTSDGDIGEIIPSSHLVIKPSLHGLIRGAGATSHDDGAVSFYVNEHVVCDIAAYFTQDEDQSLEDALISIIRRSGGSASCETCISGVVSGVVPVRGAHRDFIASFEMPVMDVDDSVGMNFRDGFQLIWERDGDEYKLRLYALGNTLLEEVSYQSIPSGTCKISVHGDLFSVWLNGRYIHTFHSEAYKLGDDVSYISTVPISVHLSELDDLLPDVVVGVRGNGMSVLSELISDRHIMFRENSDGSLFFYRTRQEVVVLPDIVSSMVRATSDNVFSRLRAEGIQLAEIIDTSILQERGNSFATVNVRYANTLVDAEKEARLILTEMRQKADMTTFSLTPHPSVQPGDEIVYDGHSYYVNGQVMSIGFNGEAFRADMQIQAIAKIEAP